MVSTMPEPKRATDVQGKRPTTTLNVTGETLHLIKKVAVYRKMPPYKLLMEPDVLDFLNHLLAAEKLKAGEELPQKRKT